MKTRLVYAVTLIVLYGCAAAPRPAVENPLPEQKAEPKTQPAAPADAGTLASPALQKETLNMILFTDDALSHGIKCSGRRIIKKEVIEQTDGSWTERWTLDRCGTILRYRVFYTSGKKGTAYFTVKIEK